ncbi:hypothetical protein QQS16_01710 [Streptomyces sp. ALI-76-A]|nr:hypothetical protein [Streptomyces sp. ALI-76-A]MDL5198888.1 hypothetical protein [Streptomyces sp. ALI-76-A]
MPSARATYVNLCALYGVTDQQVIDALMEMARESGQRGWWHAYGELSDSVYIGLETDAVSSTPTRPR